MPILNKKLIANTIPCHLQGSDRTLPKQDVSILRKTLWKTKTRRPFYHKSLTQQPSTQKTVMLQKVWTQTASLSATHKLWNIKFFTYGSIQYTGVSPSRCEIFITAKLVISLVTESGRKLTTGVKLEVDVKKWGSCFSRFFYLKFRVVF